MSFIHVARCVARNLGSWNYTNTNSGTVITAITTGATATTHALAILSFHFAFHFLISSDRGGSQHEK